MNLVRFYEVSSSKSTRATHSKKLHNKLVRPNSCKYSYFTGFKSMEQSAKIFIITLKAIILMTCKLQWWIQTYVELRRWFVLGALSLDLPLLHLFNDIYFCIFCVLGSLSYTCRAITSNLPSKTHFICCFTPVKIILTSNTKKVYCVLSKNACSLY